MPAQRARRALRRRSARRAGRGRSGRCRSSPAPPPPRPTSRAARSGCPQRQATPARPATAPMTMRVEPISCRRRRCFPQTGGRQGPDHPASARRGRVRLRPSQCPRVRDAAIDLRAPHRAAAPLPPRHRPRAGCRRSQRAPPRPRRYPRLPQQRQRLRVGACRSRLVTGERPGHAHDEVGATEGKRVAELAGRAPALPRRGRWRPDRLRGSWSRRRQASSASARTASGASGAARRAGSSQRRTSAW